MNKTTNGLVTVLILFTLFSISAYGEQKPVSNPPSHAITVLPENDEIDTDFVTGTSDASSVGDHKNHKYVDGKGHAKFVPGSIRVMISALYDDAAHKYHKGVREDGTLYDYQTEDGKVTVTVEIRFKKKECNPDGNPADPNAIQTNDDILHRWPVWFLVQDPYDPSPYVTQVSPANHDPAKRGTITVPEGYTAKQDTITYNGMVVGIGVYPQYVREEGTPGHEADDDWKMRVYEAKIVLNITHRYGGDNYKVLMAYNKKPLPTQMYDDNSPKIKNGRFTWECQTTGTMYAWKRLYLEVDKMFRAGSYLTANAAAAQKDIQLESVNGLAANDKIYVFSSDDTHENAEIDSVNTGTKTITLKENLSNAYAKGDSGKEAAVGKLIYAGQNLDDAQTFFTGPDNIPDVLKQCYEPAFVEFVELSDGEGYLPHDEHVGQHNGNEGYDDGVLAEHAHLIQFSKRWFKNRDTRDDDKWFSQDDFNAGKPPERGNQDTGKPNYLHLLLADQIDGPSNQRQGVSCYEGNAVFIWNGAIEWKYNVYEHPDTVKAAQKHVINHEIGHQFQLGYFTHCSNNAYNRFEKDPREDCIMRSNGTEDVEENNGIWRFCIEHIYKGMDMPAHAPYGAFHESGIRDAGFLDENGTEKDWR